MQQFFLIFLSLATVLSSCEKEDTFCECCDSTVINGYVFNGSIKLNNTDTTFSTSYVTICNNQFSLTAKEEKEGKPFSWLILRNLNLNDTVFYNTDLSSPFVEVGGRADGGGGCSFSTRNFSNGYGIVKQLNDLKYQIISHSKLIRSLAGGGCFFNGVYYDTISVEINVELTKI
jgi:hypothetical protein